MAKGIGLAGLLAVIAATPAAAAPCEWFGTRLDCPFASTDVVIGTQTSEDPRRTSSFVPFSFQGGGGDWVKADTSSAGRWRVEVQDIGKDPRLCRRIGGERYCY